MCGISVIINKDIKKIYNKLLLSLYQIKHRGYDSVGMLFINDKIIRLYKEISIKNKLAFHFLNNHIDNDMYYIGIGHNRMASLGNNNIDNTHPIISNNKIFVIHNGTISNFDYLNKSFFNNKYDNDTHIITELIYLFYDKYKDMIKSIKYTTKLLKGTYGLIIYNIELCNTIYIIKNDIPLMIGYNDDSIYITSELYGFCNEVNYFSSLNDNKLYIIDNYKIINKDLIFIPYIKSNINEINNIDFVNKEIIKTPYYINKLINNISFDNLNTLYFNNNINLIYNDKINKFKYYFNFIFNDKINKNNNEYFNIYFSYFSDNNKIYENLKYNNENKNYLTIISNKYSHIGNLSNNILLCNIGREKNIYSIKSELSNIITITLLYMNIYNDYKYMNDLLNLSNSIQYIFNIISKTSIKLNNIIYVKYENVLNKMIYQHIKKKYINIITIKENDNFDIYMTNNFIIIKKHKIKLRNNFFNFFINFYIIHYYIYKNFFLNNY